MIALIPAYKDYLSYVNANTFDLEVIFTKKYIDYRTKGSSSLKKVLPVICSGLSYDNEEIQDGTTAMETWGELVTNNKSKFKNQIRKNLLSYCKKDSMAMVEIHKEVYKL